MDLEESGDQTIAAITTISSRIMQVEIPEWHRVPVIPITEITSFTIGGITAAMGVKINNQAILNFLFQSLTWLQTTISRDRQQNLARRHSA